jgi:hippurate hydrolase
VIPAPLFFLLASAGPTHEVDSVFTDARALYTELHRAPELSFHETKTAAVLAARLRRLGFQVTEKVGGTGIVAVIQNGAGPTILLRTELDALPVEEKTGLPFASKVRTKDDAGNDIPVFHACGHDVHMASLVGTAALMSKTKNAWQGTLILIGQPAEERSGGAAAMIKDGLFTRFPKPDAALALHVGNELAVGTIGLVPGVYNTNSDTVRIVIYGKGGHGSAPHTAIDPVLIAARTIIGLQTIASREVKPGEFVVVTVGAIHAGTRPNIISDQAELLLTVRTRKPEIRAQVLAAIRRIAEAEARAALAPKPPLVETSDPADLVYNDPSLMERLKKPLEDALGPEHVIMTEPITASEDFSAFVEAGVPGAYFSLGGADPQKLAEATKAGGVLPSNHSPFFAPEFEPAIKTAIAAEVAMLRSLLRKR